jgi:hypothetical protein
MGSGYARPGTSGDAIMRKPFLVFIATAVALTMGTAMAGPLSVPSQPVVSGDNGMLVTVAKKVVKKKKTVKKTNKNGKVTKKTTTSKKTVKYNNNRRYSARVTYRPYRAWNRRPYYGSVVAGVTIGTVLVVSASRIPVQPDPDVCWYWSNNAMTRGYWDYCVPR